MVEHAGTSSERTHDGMLGFSDWLPIYREDQERIQRNAEARDRQIGELAAGIARLESSVSTLVEAQKGVLGQIHRPTNWGEILTGVGVLIVGAGLLINPIDNRLKDNQKFDDRVLEHMLEDAYDKGQSDTDMKWLEKMEDRLNERIHRRLE